MKKIITTLFAFTFTLCAITAQSDDDLFGGSDDDFFADDGIDIVDEVTAKSDLSKGTLFENGSIKIGGKIDASIGTSTVLYADDDASFGDHIKDTTLTPKLDALLSVDARPTETLRMYTKFGFCYPFKSTFSGYTAAGASPEILGIDASGMPIFGTKVDGTFADYFKVKELFTDFSVADRAFFRFGLHTVTWGTGYFFSPVSDIINATSINPEDTDAQVDGVLNLRTQITFPGSQNCLWMYVVPSSDFNAGSLETYAKQTALAGKYEFLIGGWEFGLGGYWKYQNAPKAMITFTGSLEKVSFFGELVYQYGGATEWLLNSDWDNKKNIIQATVGLSYYWKDPMITLAAQYYYDGNDKDIYHQYFTYGHNIAALANFGKILGNQDFTATIFGMVNVGKDDLPGMYKAMLDQMGMGSFVNTATFSAMVNYTPFKEFTAGIGPYITMNAWDEKPVVSLKLNFTLGGGKF